MVCRECGAYNAEHLTHCRVCAAKLRDDAAPAATVPTAAAEESGDRPARGFVAAPSWPKGAFSGAPENPPLKAAAPAPIQPSPRPLTQQAAEPATRRACPHCGKATLADAPYCAYCGELLSGPAKAAAAAMPAARPAAPAPVKKQANRPAPVDDYDDDDYDDDYDDDEEEEEEDIKPAKRNKRAAKVDYDDEFDDDDDDEFDDDDYDDEDYDELPKKRGKGTTILFWGLIVLLIAVIAICGKVIADRNFDGDIGKMVSSIGSIFGGKDEQSTEEAPAAEGDTGTAAATMYTATVTPFTDPAGSRWYDVNVIAPTGSKVQVISSAALETSEAVVPQYDNVILRVAESVFLPGAPCESETITVTPNIQVVTTDGQTIPITVEPITIAVPVLSMTLESPAETTVQATFANDPIVITGVVDDPSTTDDHTVEVYINGQKIDVYDGGHFTYNYTPTIAPTVAQAPAAATATATTDPAAEATTAPETATTPADGIGETVGAATADTAADDTTVSEDEAASDDTTAAAGAETPAANTAVSGVGETITVEARKNNCVSAKTVITVEPYVFQNMTLTVNNDPATGLGSPDGNVTLQGTVTPGAVLTVACDSDKVSFGEPTVSATGNYTIAVTVSAVGAYNVTLTATQQGYNDTKTKTIVERPPSDTYKKFKAGAKELSSIIAKVTAGEVTSGDVYFTGTVTEILGTTPYTIFKVKLSDDTEVVCVNRSAKSTINSGDVKEKKQLFGSLAGFYNESTTPYIWVWFSLNK